MTRTSRPAQAVEVVPGRFYVAFLQHTEGIIAASAQDTITYSIDAELVRLSTGCTAEPGCGAASTAHARMQSQLQAPFPRPSRSFTSHSMLILDL